MHIATTTAASSRLHVPAALRAQLDAAVDTGRADAEGWARVHPTGSTRRFRDDAIERLGTPPTGSSAAHELQAVREAAATRTPEGIEIAEALAARAGWETWEALIDTVGERHGVDQARRAAHLVQLAAARTDEASSIAKRVHDRPRPFEVDPTIGAVVRHPGTNASFPSGHASGAYAAALILAGFLPDRSAEIVDLAAQVAWSRMYAGVHFPSDVIAGARLASAVVSDVLRREAADLPAS